MAWLARRSPFSPFWVRFAPSSRILGLAIDQRTADHYENAPPIQSLLGAERAALFRTVMLTARVTCISQSAGIN